MKVLVVIDMQNDFIDGALGTKEAEGIVPFVKKRIEEARENGEKIFFTRDTHYEDYLNTQEGKKLPVVHCVKGTQGWHISKELDYRADEIIDKPSFGSVGLAQEIMKEQPESIEILGLCTDICVISNALILKAAMPEIPICVNAKGCAGVTPESHNNALEAMKMCQIDIVE